MNRHTQLLLMIKTDTHKHLIYNISNNDHDKINMLTDEKLYDPLYQFYH